VKGIFLFFVPEPKQKLDLQKAWESYFIFLQDKQKRG